MDKVEIKEKVIQSVIRHQEMSGRSIGEVSGGTRPIGGVQGFDSLSGVEATLILSDLIGHDIPENINPFIAEHGSRANTVDEIADVVCSIMGVN